MSFPASRREFLRRLPLAGALAPLLGRAAQTAGAAPGSFTPQLEREFFAVAFDTATGRLEVRRADGTLWLSGTTARVRTATGLRATSEPAYRHTVDVVPLEGRLGSGRQLVVRCTDGERQLDLELRVALPDGRRAVVIELEVRNVSTQALTVTRLEPLCAAAESAGALHWPHTCKVLTNGAMYYDPGRVTEPPAADAEALRSWWNVGLFRGYDREGLAAGYLENQTALGHVLLRRHGDHRLGLVAEALLAEGFELRPGRTLRSGRFMLSLAADPYAALENYAGAMGQLLDARVHSILNGWCDWFYAFEHVTEEEVVRNAECAARWLKPYGLEYIQVDEGFQRWHGEWEGNDRFPHGMQWLAERIRALGLKPGIWIAPYVISEPTEVFQRHPDWLLRHPDGRLKRVGPWPSEDTDWARNENPKRYGLDLTHPGAARWLAQLFDTVGPRWGYEMVKIDFVDWSLLSAPRYHDPTVTRAAAYRRGFEIMRRALGPDRHLQDCGPGPVTVGLLDSMRIELDQNYGFRSQAWRQYFGSSTGSAAAAAKRYYFHRRAWVNDADHLCLQQLTLPQARAAASLLALTGGNLLSGDRLPDLDPARLEILRKVLPAFGAAARPVDLFDSDRPTVFALPIRKPFGSWTVVGLFNPDETDAVERTLPLERLGLEADRTYLAYDFWDERLHGEVRRELRVRVAPASSVLLALHERRAAPQVLSADRHVLQGAWELEDVTWDAATRTLAGVSLGPVGTAHHVTVYVPEPQPWRQGGPFLFHDFPGYTLKMVAEHLLRVRVRFEHEPRVAWRIRFDDFLGRR